MLVPTRLYLLGFIFSRMLTPVSFTVFLLFFMSVYVVVLDVIPTTNWHLVIMLVSKMYTLLLFIRLLLFATACTLLGLCVFKIVVFGLFIVRRAMFSLILALSIAHSVIYYCVNGLPLQLSMMQRQHSLHVMFSTVPIEVMTTIFLGIMLSLYVGILSSENFKKDIGFVDDTL